MATFFEVLLKAEDLPGDGWRLMEEGSHRTEFVRYSRSGWRRFDSAGLQRKIYCDVVEWRSRAGAQRSFLKQANYTASEATSGQPGARRIDLREIEGLEHLSAIEVPVGLEPSQLLSGWVGRTEMSIACSANVSPFTWEEVSTLAATMARRILS
jgi:hypothetical protein